MLRSVALSVCLAFIAAGAAQGPDIRRDFILLDKEAVGMMSPRVACSAYATSLKWSPDGSLLLIQHMDAAEGEAQIQAMFSGKLAGEPVAPKTELVFYAMRSNRIKATVPFNAAQVHVHSVEWVPGSSQVVCEYSRARLAADGTPDGTMTEVALVSSDGRVHPIASVADGEWINLSVSPQDPLIAVVHTSFVLPTPGSGQAGQVVGELDVIPASGPARPAMKLPAGFSEFQWGADHKAYVCIREFSKERKSVSTTWRELSLSTGQLGAPMKQFPRFEPKAESKSGLQAMGTKFKPAVPKAVANWVPDVDAVGLFSDLLQSDPSTENGFAFASTDGVSGALSPSGDAIAYIHHGVAMVRPLIRIPKEAFLQALAAAKRTEIISNAKQVGLGLIMFAADNDDILPNGGNLTDTIDPYLKNKDLMNGFIFSLGGANLSKVDKPAETEMGYIPGPGGRAVVYADGHVRWIPNP